MVANLTPFCDLVADIGTDHGYLPIFLVNKGICKRAIAADINSGPLCAAKKNIASTKVRDKIEIIQSDGLKNIENADCVTIAGMGGELIASILENRKEAMTRFVLQPQRSYDVLRRYLCENGFEIKKEAVAKENDKMYCAFYAEYTGKIGTMSERDALLGKSELMENKILHQEYVEYRRREIEKAISQMEKADTKGERYDELKRLLEVLV